MKVPYTPWLKYRKMPVEFQSHYLDSGSFTLKVVAAKYAKKHNTGPFSYYDTSEFWSFVEDYCEFVEKYKAAIDHYSVVDVIPNPERTWEVQQWMEDRALHPVPVVHYPTNLKWLEHYLNRGHDYIAIGGIIGGHNQLNCQNWLDRAFQIVGDEKGMPRVRLHGFAATSFFIMLRYPWYSVDSSTWLKVGAYGGIFVPPKRKGRFVFDEPPYIVKTAFESPERKKVGAHLLTISSLERDLVYQWLDRIEIPVGRMSELGEIKEVGVINDHSTRLITNMIYFEQFSGHIPKYPWAFKSSRQKGFGIQL